MKRPIIIENEPRGQNKPDKTHRVFDKVEYDKVTSDPKNLWVRHTILPEFSKELKKDKRRDNYEDFVYGFMYHFDNHSPKEKWDVEKDGEHKLYFKWTEIKNEVVSVDIYIIPAPQNPFDSTIVNPGIDPERPPAPPPPPAEA